MSGRTLASRYVWVFGGRVAMLLSTPPASVRATRYPSSTPELSVQFKVMLCGSSALADRPYGPSGSVVQSGVDGAEGPAELKAVTRKQTTCSVGVETKSEVALAGALPAAAHGPVTALARSI